MTLHEKSTSAMADMDQYVDTALAESARNIELQRSHVLQTWEEWRTDSSDLAKIAQTHLEEIGGKTQEQAQALRESLWRWGQSSSSDQVRTNGDEAKGNSFEFGEKAHKHIQAFGAT